MEISEVTPEELEEKYLALSFPAVQDRPYVIINMVMSLDGSVTVVDPQTGQPSERGLGSTLDQRMMRVLRFHADATLNGAATLRISGSGSEIGDPVLVERRKKSGKAGNPIAVILTSDVGKLPLGKDSIGSSFFYSKEFEALIFTTEKSSEEAIKKVEEQTGRRVEVLPDRADDVKEMLRRLKENHGVNLLLCEGGPTINGSLLVNGLVDELFFTVSSKLVGGGKHPFGLPEALNKDNLVKTSLLSAYYVEETLELYLHYKVA